MIYVVTSNLSSPSRKIYLRRTIPVVFIGMATLFWVDSDGQTDASRVQLENRNLSRIRRALVHYARHADPSLRCGKGRGLEKKGFGSFKLWRVKVNEETKIPRFHYCNRQDFETCIDGRSDSEWQSFSNGLHETLLNGVRGCGGAPRGLA